MIKNPCLATLNIYWVLATGLCVWFLFIHAPQFLKAKPGGLSILLIFHLIGAYYVYLACVHNTLVTPSAFCGKARPWHVWVGRVAMVSALFGLVSGFVLTWMEFIQQHGDEPHELGDSIGISVGGAGQLWAITFGYKAIRKYQRLGKIKQTLQQENELKDGEEKEQQTKSIAELQEEQDEALKVHIQQMIFLFVLACGIPALMRIAEFVGRRQTWGFALMFPLLIVIGIILSRIWAKWFFRRLAAKRRLQEEEQQDFATKTTKRSAHDDVDAEMHNSVSDGASSAAEMVVEPEESEDEKSEDFPSKTDFSSEKSSILYLDRPVGLDI